MLFSMRKDEKDEKEPVGDHMWPFIDALRQHIDAHGRPQTEGEVMPFVDAIRCAYFSGPPDDVGTRGQDGYALFVMAGTCPN